MISLCDDKEEIKRFINEHWKRGHILATSDKFLDWMYKGKNSYNFIGDFKGNRIKSILGFVSTSQYDENLEGNKDFWLTLWKAIENVNGLDVLLFLMKEFKPNSVGVIGISEIAFEIYKKLRFNTGILNHYFVFNSEMQSYSIAKVNNYNINTYKESTKKYSADPEVELVKITSNIEELHKISDLYKPFKSVQYIMNRYLQHPVYKYDVYGVYHKNRLLYAFVIRKVTVGSSNCLRIVDIYGKIAPQFNIRRKLEDLLIQNNSEYIDLYNYGISECVITQIGFEKRVKDEVIIPNYFEPFIQENVELKYAYKSCYSDYVIFKGDSDQDRPNFIT